MHYYEPTYHIYLNNTCIKSNLNDQEFHKEMAWINNFLQLTKLDKAAKVEYVRCDPPSRVMLEGSY